jgi:hypothetical protein
MPHLKPVRDIAPQSDPPWSISRLQLEARLSMGTARRYWYGTSDGTPNGPRVTVVDLITAERVATALGLTLGTLLIELVEGRRSLQTAPALQVQPTGG